MTEENGRLFPEDLLRQIRERFCYVESDPIVGPRIYLENTGGGLTLKKVVEVVAEQTALPDNEGRENATSQAVTNILAQGKADVALLVGARSGVIAVGESTTSLVYRVLEAVIANVLGNNVVTTNLDHPSVYDATRILAERFHKEWRVAELSPQIGNVDPQAVLKHVDSNTVLLAVIHASNITGMRNDVAAMIREARKIKPDLVAVVDGAQHGCHDTVDVEELQCDAYFLSSYKLFSKVGAAAVHIADRISRLPHDRLLGKPDDYWELGTREQAGYAAWSEVVKYLCWLGGHFTKSSDRREQIVAAMKAIEQHERALTYRMLRGTNGIRGLLDMEFVAVYGEVNDLTNREPCLAINVEGMTSGEFVTYMVTKGISVHDRVSDAYSKHTLQELGIKQCGRVSMGHYNSPEEVDAFLRALEQTKR